MTIDPFLKFVNSKQALDETRPNSPKQRKNKEKKREKKSNSHHTPPRPGIHRRSGRSRSPLILRVPPRRFSRRGISPPDTPGPVLAFPLLLVPFFLLLLSNLRANLHRRFLGSPSFPRPVQSRLLVLRRNPGVIGDASDPRALSAQRDLGTGRSRLTRPRQDFAFEPLVEPPGDFHPPHGRVIDDQSVGTPSLLESDVLVVQEVLLKLMKAGSEGARATEVATVCDGRGQ